MRKRLRKKLRRGEFREFGFLVKFRLADGVSGPALDEFWDQFITQAVEARDLVVGGGSDRDCSVFVTRAGHGSASEEDRLSLGTWLEQHPQVCDIVVGRLEDAWLAV